MQNDTQTELMSSCAMHAQPQQTTVDCAHARINHILKPIALYHRHAGHTQQGPHMVESTDNHCNDEQLEPSLRTRQSLQ
jgi:hypothetical protein